MPRQILLRLYCALLNLYPRRFRDEFATEMYAVFSEAVEEAAGNGGSIIRGVFLNELRDFPLAVLGAHYRDRFNREPDPMVSKARWAGPLSAKEMLVALVAFILPVGFILFNTSPTLPLGLVIPGILIFIVITFTVGMIQGFPRWSLPYLGQVLSITGYLFLFQWVADLLSPSIISKLGAAPWDESSYLLLQAFSAGFLWLSLFGLTLLILVLLAILPWFRPLYWHIRQDWSLVSFILYGEAVVALILLYEEYRFKEHYAIASLLLLGAGAWLYLRSPVLWQRILALFAGLTLALWAPAVVKWVVAADQKWTTWIQWHPLEMESWLEAGKTVLEWSWMMLVLLAPALLGFFPPGEKNKPVG